MCDGGNHPPHDGVPIRWLTDGMTGLLENQRNQKNHPKSTVLIKLIRCHQIKLGDGDVKQAAIHKAHHLVFAFHAAHICF